MKTYRAVYSRKYGVFTADDIWKALHKAAIDENTISSDMCIKEIATSWVTKDRLPVVSIERNYQKKTAVASQVSLIFFKTKFLDHIINYYIYTEGLFTGKTS